MSVAASCISVRANNFKCCPTHHPLSFRQRRQGMLHTLSRKAWQTWRSCKFSDCKGWTWIWWTWIYRDLCAYTFLAHGIMNHVTTEDWWAWMKSLRNSTNPQIGAALQAAQFNRLFFFAAKSTCDTAPDKQAVGRVAASSGYNGFTLLAKKSGCTTQTVVVRRAGKTSSCGKSEMPRASHISFSFGGCFYDSESKR